MFYDEFNIISPDASIDEAMAVRQFDEEFAHVQPTDFGEKYAAECAYKLELCYNNIVKSMALAELKYYTENGIVLEEANDERSKTVLAKFVESVKKLIRKAIDLLAGAFKAAKNKFIVLAASNKRFLDKYEHELLNASNDDYIILGNAYTFEGIGTRVEIFHAVIDDYKWYDMEKNEATKSEKDILDDYKRRFYGETKDKIKIKIRDAEKILRNTQNDIKDLWEDYRYFEGYLKAVRDNKVPQIAINDKAEANRKLKEVSKCTSILNKIYNMKIDAILARSRQAKAALIVYIQQKAQNENNDFEESAVLETSKDSFKSKSLEDMFAEVYSI